MNFHVQITSTIKFLPLARSPDIVLHFSWVWLGCPQTWIFYEYFSSDVVRKAHLLTITLPHLYKAVAQPIFILRYSFLQETIFERFPFFTFNQNLSNSKVTRTKLAWKWGFHSFSKLTDFLTHGYQNNRLNIFRFQILQPSLCSNPSTKSQLLNTKLHALMIYFPFQASYTKWRLP